MAYEHMTYEYILQRMMARVVEQYPNLDSREGSIIFNALAPAAVELAIQYTELDNVLSESFVDTASREYLLLACEQIGMNTNSFIESAGVHKAQFNVKVAIGSRWNCDLYNYTVTEYIGLENARYTYQVVCETAGIEPNKATGDLTPITESPSGLSYAKLVECLVEGEDEATDETIRTAYRNFITSSTTDGNIAQYERWCNEYDGIGNSQVIPLWNGANTVKLCILSASNRAASDELIAEFQEYIDPGVSGMGDGKAPIGAFVTVDTATEVPINMVAEITLESGYTDTTPINEALTKYFAEKALKSRVVPYMTIGAVILGVEGVSSISNLTLNGKASDIVIDAEQIPVLGTTNWEG